MRYYKTILDDGTVFVSTLDADGDGNIPEEEYETIVVLYKNAPAGKVVVEDGTGYAYADAPAPQDEDLPADALAEILLEGVTE